MTITELLTQWNESNSNEISLQIIKELKTEGKTKNRKTTGYTRARSLELRPEIAAILDYKIPKTEIKKFLDYLLIAKQALISLDAMSKWIKMKEFEMERMMIVVLHKVMTYVHADDLFKWLCDSFKRCFSVDALMKNLSIDSSCHLVTHCNDLDFLLEYQYCAFRFLLLNKEEYRKLLCEEFGLLYWIKQTESTKFALVTGKTIAANFRSAPMNQSDFEICFCLVECFFSEPNLMLEQCTRICMIADQSKIESREILRLYSKMFSYSSVFDKSADKSLLRAFDHALSLGFDSQEISKHAEQSLTESDCKQEYINMLRGTHVLPIECCCFSDYSQSFARLSSDLTALETLLTREPEILLKRITDDDSLSSLVDKMPSDLFYRFLCILYKKEEFDRCLLFGEQNLMNSDIAELVVSVCSQKQDYLKAVECLKKYLKSHKLDLTHGSKDVLLIDKLGKYLNRCGIESSLEQVLGFEYIERFRDKTDSSEMISVLFQKLQHHESEDCFKNVKSCLNAIQLEPQEHLRARLYCILVLWEFYAAKFNKKSVHKLISLYKDKQKDLEDTNLIFLVQELLGALGEFKLRLKVLSLLEGVDLQINLADPRVETEISLGYLTAERPGAVFWKCMTFLSQGDYKEAQDLIKRSKKRLKNSEVYYIRSCISRFEGKLDQAIVFLRKAVKTIPKDEYSNWTQVSFYFMMYANLGDLCSVYGNCKEAKYYYSQGLHLAKEIGSTNFTALFTLYLKQLFQRMKVENEDSFMVIDQDFEALTAFDILLRANETALISMEDAIEQVDQVFKVIDSVQSPGPKIKSIEFQCNILKGNSIETDSLFLEETFAAIHQKAVTSLKSEIQLQVIFPFLSGIRLSKEERKAKETLINVFHSGYESGFSDCCIKVANILSYLHYKEGDIDSAMYYTEVGKSIGVKRMKRLQLQSEIKIHPWADLDTLPEDGLETLKRYKSISKEDIFFEIPSNIQVVSLSFDEFSEMFQISILKGKHREHLQIHVHDFEEYGKDLGDILRESKESTKGSFETREERSKWWRTRQELDDRMKDFCESIQDNWFGPFAGIFVDVLVCEKFRVSLTEYLTAKTGLRIDIPEYILRCFHLADISMSSLLVSHLINSLNLLQVEIDRTAFIKFLKSFNLQKNIKDTQIVLILDKHLQPFPFESMNILNTRSVYRLHSLSILRDKLENCNQIVKVKNVTAIVNPEGDLKSTEKQFVEPMRK